MNAALPLRTAAGDALADEFEYWWNVPGEWVEPPNERRSGWSGMLRTRHLGDVFYVKRQRDHQCHTLLHPLGWPTASREWHYLQRLQRLGVRSPIPVFHRSVRGLDGVACVLVTEELHGFAPLAAQTGLSRRRRDALARETGRVLARLHRARLQHGCLYDKHIMVRWYGNTPEVALIDLEKMRSRLTRTAAAKHDLDQLRRHQALWSPEEWALLELAHAASMAD